VHGHQADPAIGDTRDAFLNAVVVNSALGGSTNAPIHLVAIARHMGVEHTLEDWQRYGHQVPLLVNLQPSGEYLGEDFYRAGGVPAVIAQLMCQGTIDVAAIEAQYGVDFGGYFADELQQLEVLAADGLVRLAPQAITATPAGRLLLRNIAMCFDRYLGAPPTAAAAVPLSRAV